MTAWIRKTFRVALVRFTFGCESDDEARLILHLVCVGLRDCADNLRTDLRVVPKAPHGD